MTERRHTNVAALSVGNERLALALTLSSDVARTDDMNGGLTETQHVILLYEL